jgi:hypothetical protein
MKQGYGEIYSKLIIKNNILIKESKNNLGKKKIQNEINFYNFILKNEINFPIPKIFNFQNNIENNKIEMFYYKNYITLLDYLIKFNNNIIIDKIFNYINNLHSNSEKTLKKEEFRKIILLETIKKVKNRYLLIEKFIEKYYFIKKVNNIEIYSFEYILGKLEKLLLKEIDKLEPKFNPIHGDIHLNNILINPNTNKIIFIDPKGIFGKEQIYGLKEYDYSKFYFGLEGYSKFDFSTIYNLDIENDNINIKMETFNINENKKNKLIEILIILIWMGNAHAFKCDKKKIISYFYSLYLGSLFLIKKKLF